MEERDDTPPGITGMAPVYRKVRAGDAKDGRVF